MPWWTSCLQRLTAASPCCRLVGLHFSVYFLSNCCLDPVIHILLVESVTDRRADRLESTADITFGLQLGRAEVLRGLRNFLNTDKPEHHSIDRLKERGVEKGSGRHSTLQGQERSVFNQANIGTVSRATLGRLLRDGVKRVWAFPSATMPS